MTEAAIFEFPSPTTRKAERTRLAILEAASRLFSERGYDGTGIRDIETAAGVKRGVVTYHLGNKEEVWKAAFSYTVAPLLEDLESKKDLIRQLEPERRRRFLVANFVRQSAERPQVNNLMLQENLAKTWRIDWIVETFLEPMRRSLLEISDDDPALRAFVTDPHLHYILLGACNLAFSLAGEAQAMYGQNVHDDSFVERHIEAVMHIFENYTRR